MNTLRCDVISMSILVIIQLQHISIKQITYENNNDQHMKKLDPNRYSLLSPPLFAYLIINQKRLLMVIINIRSYWTAFGQHFPSCWQEYAAAQ